ncbi:hypothetical protein LCGC14_1565860 [marine sediment metagenome]|uniref:Uncharacterized protein n=1 Tax=marine sediment metagenome TaxID=412755 RepID=A0A0F9IL28_9ZZZZ
MTEKYLVDCPTTILWGLLLLNLVFFTHQIILGSYWAFSSYGGVMVSSYVLHKIYYKWKPEIAQMEKEIQEIQGQIRSHYNTYLTRIR